MVSFSPKHACHCIRGEGPNERVDHGGVDRPSRSDLMRPLGLTVQEKSDLVAFLQSLTCNLAPTAAPVLPR